MKKLSAPTSLPERPIFRGFEAENDSWSTFGYRRNLPHWRLEGATYFVTFRLADSIPSSAVKRWEDEESKWLGRRGIDAAWRRDAPHRFQQALANLPPSDLAASHSERTHRFFIELDRCHGSCILRNQAARIWVAGALHYFHGQRVWVGDFVVMRNHVHVLVLPFPGVRLEDWLYSVKRFSAGRILKEVSLQTLVQKRAGHVWQSEAFDRVVRDEGELARLREYIASNPRPLREGEFTHHRADWPASIDA